MSEVVFDAGYLGPVTEARFAKVFETRAVADKGVAADLIGVDVKTMDTLPIRWVPKGAKHKGYTERDLRRFLTEGQAEPCAPAQPKPNARPQPNPKVVNFSERRRSRG